VARWPPPLIIGGHPADGDGNALTDPASTVARLQGAGTVVVATRRLADAYARAAPRPPPD